MENNQKITKHAFVMTGGGAKGYYEAGVIHAFHLCGMEFDIITGSSIGAINAVFYAEYLLHKKGLDKEIQEDPFRALEMLDGRLKKFHQAWLEFPDENIIDDSEGQPIANLKNDLQRFGLKVKHIVRLAWWGTDPKKPSPPLLVIITLANIFRMLIGRFRSVRVPLKIVQEYKSDPPELIMQILRKYLGQSRFGIGSSLIKPEEGDKKLTSLFTRYDLVDPKRTFRDYFNRDIDLQLTRANYRTGRLEISAYVSVEAFAAFLQKHAWRWQKDRHHPSSLAKARLQIVGNPNAIKAALTSGRFPGVFTPYAIRDIYDIHSEPDEKEEPENALLYQLLSGWLDHEHVLEQLESAYWQRFPDNKSWQWESLVKNTKALKLLFPKSNDVYVDGGTIDNIPTNSAIDATRDWAAATNTSRRDLKLVLYVIFLSPAPDFDEFTPLESEPNAYDVVRRTLSIRSDTMLPSDAVITNTISAASEQGQQLGRMLQMVSKGVDEIIDKVEEDLPGELSDEQKTAVQIALQDRLEESLRSQAELNNIKISDKSEALDQLMEQANEVVDRRLPIDVESVEIYPEEMPMGTLDFTERLGYKRENAIQMLTAGCYNTLWTMRAHLESKNEKNPPLDDTETKTLAMLHHWMEPLGDNKKEKGAFSKNWRCRRYTCAHYTDCRHGGVKSP